MFLRYPLSVQEAQAAVRSNGSSRRNLVPQSAGGSRLNSKTWLAHHGAAKLPRP